MTPSIAFRIDSMMQALSDIVLPAIGTDKNLAREQAQLVMAHLMLIRGQLDRAVDYDRMELLAATALADRLLPLAQGGPRISGAAQATRSVLGEIGEIEDRQDAIRRINQAMEDLMRASRVDGDTASQAAISSAVFAHAKEHSLRNRVWFGANNFDADRASLPDIASLFKTSFKTGKGES